MLKRCSRCKNGVVNTGNNDLPCDCLKGSLALFNIAGVEGLVTGAESRRHFLNGSPEPLSLKKISASSLPGRNKDMRKLKIILRRSMIFLERFEQEKETSKIKIRRLYTFAHNLHTVTSKMLGK